MTEEGLLPDFSEAVEFDNEQVPPGVYKVRVDSFQNKLSKANANYVQWKLVIFGAEGELARQNNRVLYTNTMLSGKGAGVLKQFITAALGELPKSFEPGWQNALIGREVQITAVKNLKPDGTEGFPNVRSIAAIR